MADPINCPYCDAEIDTTDFFEFEDEDTTTCDECDKLFHVNREVEVTYRAKRVECEEGKHEYLEWVRMDIGHDTLSRWLADPSMARHVKEREPYSYFSRHCSSCDDIDYSPNVTYMADLPQNQIRSRYDD